MTTSPHGHRGQLSTRSVGAIDGAAPTGVSPAGTTVHHQLERLDLDDGDARPAGPRRLDQTQDIRVTVTTPTSFGWTEEPAISGAVKC